MKGRGAAPFSSLRPWWLVATILAAAMVPQLFKLFLPVKLIFSGFISDDAFYYYKTALNIREGLGSTFDAIHFTNGYHPLWMLGCTALAYLTTDLHYYLYLVLAANLGFALLLTRKVMTMFWDELGPAFAALLALLINWNYMSSTAVFSGLETPLYLWLLLTAIDLAPRTDLKSAGASARLGLCFGAAFLARTDFVLFLPVFGFYFLFRVRNDRAIPIFSALFFIGAPFAALAAPYLAWNYAMTGHLEQISGLVKDLQGGGAFSAPGVFLRAAARYVLKIMEAVAIRPAPVSILLFAWLYPAAVSLRNLRSLPALVKDERVLMLSAFALVVVGYYFVSYGGDFRYWHFAPAFLALQILFVIFLKAVHEAFAQTAAPRKFFWALTAAIWAGYFLQMPYFAYKYDRVRNYHFIATVYYQDEAAKWIREHVPPAATVGVWNAGYVGYFSERRVVNLDGLANGMELYNYFRDGRGVYQYISDQRLDYVSDYSFGEHPLTSSALAPRLQLVYHVGRAEVIKDGKPTSVDWWVWKLR